MPGESRSSSPSPSPSSSPGPYVLAFSERSDYDPIMLSDSLPAVTLELALNRCPAVDSERSATLSCAPEQSRIAADISVALSPATVTMACDAFAAVSSAIVIPSVVSVLPAFRTPGGVLKLECVLRALGGSSMGSAVANVSVEPTLWPTFDDVIVVANK